MSSASKKRLRNVKCRPTQNSQHSTSCCGLNQVGENILQNKMYKYNKILSTHTPGIHIFSNLWVFIKLAHYSPDGHQSIWDTSICYAKIQLKVPWVLCDPLNYILYSSLLNMALQIAFSMQDIIFRILTCRSLQSGTLMLQMDRENSQRIKKE